MPIQATLVLCTIALLTGCAATGTTPSGRADTTDAAVAQDAPIEAASATLTVHGMSCPLCANNVDQQLLDVRGVETVSVDMGTGKVAVRFARDHHPTRADLATAIDRSGFTLERIDTP